LSNPKAIFAGSPPRFTRSRVTYEAYVVSRTWTRPQDDSALWTPRPNVIPNRCSNRPAAPRPSGSNGCRKNCRRNRGHEGRSGRPAQRGALLGAQHGWGGGGRLIDVAGCYV